MIKRPRQKNDAHLDFVRSLSCLSCLDNSSTEAAHIRFGDIRAAKRPTGMGEKPSDCWTIPLCGRCHREQHATSEDAFWQGRGIDPVMTAAFLYLASGDHERGEQIVRAQFR